MGFGMENIAAISTGNKVMITTRDKAPELKKILQHQESTNLTH